MDEKINILLIEDNQAYSQLINGYLKESYGELFSLFIAKTLLNGLEVLASENFDVIISSLALQQNKGIDALKRIYENFSEIPIIVLIEQDSNSLRINAIELGAQDFLIRENLNAKVLKHSLESSVERNKIYKRFPVNTKILEELEQLALVAVKSYNAVTIAGKDGKIEWVNPGFTKLTGYRLEDVIGTYGEILRAGGKTGLSPGTDPYITILTEKKPLSYENKNFSKDGKEYWVLTSLTPILDRKGEVEKIISIDSDITKQKKAEEELIIANKISEYSLNKGNKALEELHKAKKQLEESLKVKEQFLANMSHEIRTPMNAIIGFTNLLLRQDNSKENKQFLDAIKNSGENLLVIINDILDLSKLESGKISFESIRFKLSQTLALLDELMLPKAVEKNIQLTTEVDENIPRLLVGDPTRLNQILINLVGNAIKFTLEGGVHLKVSILNDLKDEIELKFSIKDTGIGIPQDSLTKVFDGFTQASNDTTRKFGGTGLGLTITKQLVELQKGTISVESKVNEGSVFTFILKFKKVVQKTDANNLINHDQEESFPLEGIKVLLVEDNFFNQMLASKVLENWKCKVEVAGNGIIAIEKVKEELFDIILMDIQLPDMDGYEATSYIRTKIAAPNSLVPVIAMTAHAFANEIEKCMSYGMNDYISKPFNETILYGKIFKILNKKKNE